MDRISIRDLVVETHVGVTDEERAAPQDVVINIDIDVDLLSAGISDDIADTIDYAMVTSMVAKLVQSSETRLIETLAQRIAQRIVDIDGAAGVTVEVVKPAAPVEENVGSVSAKVVRP